MRRVRTVSLLAGVAILIFLIVRVGRDATLSSVASALGWRFPLICLPFALVNVIDTLGWRYAFPRNHVPFLRLVAARTAGEAVNVVTAVLPIGGDAVKVWLLGSHVPYRESVASVIIAKTTIVIAQLLFLVLGIVLAWMSTMDTRLLIGMLWLLLIEAICVGGLVLVQMIGVVKGGARLLSRFKALAALGSVEQLDDELHRFYRHEWRRFSLSVGFHFLGWVLGVIETVLILMVLRVSLPLTGAVVLESLNSGVRFATFFVPGSLGALEGANTGAFTVLGLGASTGLGFTLIRRGRQLVWIVIGLLVLAALRAKDRLAAARAGQAGA